MRCNYMGETKSTQQCVIVEKYYTKLLGRERMNCRCWRLEEQPKFLWGVALVALKKISWPKQMNGIVETNNTSFAGEVQRYAEA
jgi:hypothetical protein